MRKYEYDVVVIGGGAAGIAAALGASRAGAKTAIVERNANFGGQGVNSQVTAYCGFYTRGDKPTQVVKGVGQEVLDRLSGYGQDVQPTVSASTGNASIRFDPELLKWSLDDLMSESDVDLYLHTSLIDVNRVDKMIESVICIDDEGHFEMKAKSFVDASGNANLVHLSKIKTEWGDEKGEIQQTSLSFRLDNLPKQDILMKDIQEAIRLGKESGIKNLEKEKGMIIKIPNENYGYCTIPSTILNDLSAQEMTRAEIELRKQVRAYTQTFRDYMPGFEHIKVVNSGPQIGVREARRIIGEYKLIGTDIVRGPKHEDSIARGGWSPEMHRSNVALEYTHIPDHDYFSIPIGSLKVIEVDNIWGAGRMLCSDSLALGSVRVMGTGFATGQAAGVAAALTLGNSTYEIKSIQEELKRQGALI